MSKATAAELAAMGFRRPSPQEQPEQWELWVGASVCIDAVVSDGVVEHVEIDWDNDIHAEFPDITRDQLEILALMAGQLNEAASRKTFYF